MVLVMSASAGVYTGTIQTSPPPFWQYNQHSTPDAPPSAEAVMQQGDGVLGPLLDNTSVYITYIDASPPSEVQVRKASVSSGSLRLFPSPLLSSMVGVNQTIGLVLHKQIPLNTSANSSQPRQVQVVARSHSVCCVCSPGNFCPEGSKYFVPPGKPRESVFVSFAKQASVSRASHRLRALTCVIVRFRVSCKQTRVVGRELSGRKGQNSSTLPLCC
jgi:hypothetical protein